MSSPTDQPFRVTFKARWADMDFNAHMRNAAYLGEAEQCRMQYLDAHGFSMRDFERLQLGPVVMRDEIDYSGELRLLESATVDITLAGLSRDGSRFRLRNTIVRDRDGRRAAVVTSTGGWFDIVQRRLRAPPPELLAAIQSLRRDADFVELPDSV